jgi:hypothetical protein
LAHFQKPLSTIRHSSIVLIFDEFERRLLYWVRRSAGGDDEKYHGTTRLQLPTSRRFRASFRQNWPTDQVAGPEAAGSICIG